MSPHPAFILRMLVFCRKPETKLSSPHQTCVKGSKTDFIKQHTSRLLHADRAPTRTRRTDNFKGNRGTMGDNGEMGKGNQRRTGGTGWGGVVCKITEGEIGTCTF
jgi:hypothetical protein